MKLIAACMAVLMTTTGIAAAEPQKNPEETKLYQIIDREWEWMLQEFPNAATYVGDPRYDDLWPDSSPEAIERREEHARALVDELEGLDRERLSPEGRLNYDLMLRNARLTVEAQKFPGELVPLNQMGGVHQDVADLLQMQPRRTVEEYEKVIQRLRGVATLVDQDIALMRRGLEAGVTPPRITLRDVEKRIAELVVDDPAQSSIYEVAFDQMPSSISSAEQKRLREEAAKVIRESVIPAYGRLQQFFAKEYYPGTREAIGLSSVPDGRSWYDYQVRVMTTTDMTSDEIHQLGLSEVKRIRGEMESIRKQTGFEGTLQEFFDFLRTDPRFFYTDKEELLAGYRNIAKRIDPELTRLFGKLPRLTYGVLPVPEYSERTQTTAYYQPGSPEARRPGYFYANTWDLASRPKWEMEALTVHEAVPGHHLQISLAQELENVPSFRRHGGYTAFVEGWGLYSESLGPELGLYTDPYSKFGQLTYEMWRAIRLVVDTGMHAKGWTRDQAIQYFKENAGKSEHDIRVEIDRYIVWPGQALAYKIGELKIKELRALATRELGEKFDIRGFHDTVLGAGPLPLSILETRVREWIASEKG
ncbi:MAG TPA: DUF885 domain-containing protein, partial [Thermoanaerobaculia bacterium]|nr:DUF885 domain-containing protein [Thermoanaerobaculia bacterium]